MLVAAGGAGVRLGSGPPKALRVLAGEPLLVHAVRRLAAASSVGCVVVAAPPGQVGTVRELLSGLAIGSSLAVVAGGAQRQQSVAAALAAVPAEYELVLVHDAARALAPAALVEEVAAAVRAGQDAVIPVLPVTDTVTLVDGSGRVRRTLDRSTLRAVQTPQGFRRRVLVDAHAGATGDAATGDAATDDAGLVARLGVRVHAVPGSAHAFKITTSTDLTLAEALLAADPG